MCNELIGDKFKGPKNVDGRKLPIIKDIKKSPPISNFDYKWPYQWQDRHNPVGQTLHYPPLQERILTEINSAIDKEASTYLITIRGELGIGKTTLRRVLVKKNYNLLLKKESNSEKV